MSRTGVGCSDHGTLDAVDMAGVANVWSAENQRIGKTGRAMEKMGAALVASGCSAMQKVYKELFLAGLTPAARKRYPETLPEAYGLKLVEMGVGTCKNEQTRLKAIEMLMCMEGDYSHVAPQKHEVEVNLRAQPVEPVFGEGAREITFTDIEDAEEIAVDE